MRIPSLSPSKSKIKIFILKEILIKKKKYFYLLDLISEEIKKFKI